LIPWRVRAKMIPKILPLFLSTIGVGDGRVVLKCPNCGKAIPVVGRIWFSKETKCPKCGATLRLSKRKGELLIILIPTILLFSLAFGAVCYALNLEFSDAVGFRNPITSILFWSLFIFLFVLLVFEMLTLKLQVVNRAPSVASRS
jgi:predicted RNA-binding Zn-ribbon protein involved in translation (DUF1610 family)